MAKLHLRARAHTRLGQDQTIFFQVRANFKLKNSRQSSSRVKKEKLIRAKFNQSMLFSHRGAWFCIFNFNLTNDCNSQNSFMFCWGMDGKKRNENIVFYLLSTGVRNQSSLDNKRNAKKMWLKNRIKWSTFSTFLSSSCSSIFFFACFK